MLEEAKNQPIGVALLYLHMASCEDTELTFLMKLVLRPFDWGANVSRATYHKVNGAPSPASRQRGKWDFAPRHRYGETYAHKT